MKVLLEKFKTQGGDIVYNTEVVEIEKTKEGFIIKVKDKKKEEFTFLSRIVINSAGLNADKIAKMVGIEREDYILKYCKGDYFRVSPNKSSLVKHLIYPVPKPKQVGLGIHATLDLAGSLRLGPNDEYVEKIDYQIEEKKALFYESVRTFLPFIKEEDLSPDISGIRPKLQGPNDDFRDFVIESEYDLEGFINLIGIESPGLTACLAIAKLIREHLLKKL